MDVETEIDHIDNPRYDWIELYREQYSKGKIDIHQFAVKLRMISELIIDDYEYLNGIKQHKGFGKSRANFYRFPT